MNQRLILLFLLGFMGAVSCHKEQTLEEAMKILCELPKLLDGGEATDMAPRLAEEAARRITNPEVLAWMRSVISPEQRDAQLSEMLRRAHITDCWMAPKPNEP